ncbi:hypothetical protein [Glycomyces lechevalierae]|uniref:Copper chaperone PCu(A)C n=1 Tax=Glycomyces lechevalierae TaxID=256034 RepID=A0A9X3PG73_9ACTN|nr:hypothetical protein [Glycomyces lechevalierae]MDA1383554.1 hypothetical protein [Glycomyces lechevalierae]MDR7341457.1 hypothetical protein [Glycomyces lechevalierae]
MERREASAAAARVRWAAALAVVGLALAGCGASRSAQTGETNSAISGIDVDAGVIAMRDMQVDFGERGFYLEGGQAPLRIWMDNQSTESVVLEAVTSPVADAVILATDVVAEETPGAGESATPSADATESPSAGASPSPTASDSPSAGASDSASPTAGASESPSESLFAEVVGERDFEIEIAPDSYVRLAPTTGSFLLLDGLNQDVKMGSKVEVTFVFSNGEAVTVDLPMGTPEVAPSRSYFEPRHEEGAE